MAVYAVGDIQGCYDALCALLDSVKFGENDQLWCVGDLINRGGQDLQTLRFLRSLKKQVVTVLGNHDLHLLACAYGNRKVGRKDTFGEVFDAPDAEDLIQWLRSQPIMHHNEALSCTMVHAGIPHIWSLQQALKLAREVESVIQSEKAADFFANMYGNSPSRWNDELEGSERWRTITNYFTRMRFCSPDGELEFATKLGPSSPPSGYLPWYQYPQHLCNGRRILFGHWASLEGDTGRQDFIGLDTGCVWGGELTLIRLEDDQRFCVDCAF